MTDRFRIVEIFNSIEGEGKRTGQLAIFIRTAGCNLRCGYCDTTYALFGEETPCLYNELTIDEIICRLNKSYHKVTLTGGEPLFQTGIKSLIQAISSLGFEVNVETNGSIDVKPFRVADNVFFTIDYKLPSSLMESRMNKDAFLHLTPDDVVKFVIGTKNDFDRTLEVVRDLQKHYNGSTPLIYLSAVNGEMSPASLVEFMKSHEELSQSRLQVQLHKVVWPSIDKGV